MVECSFTNLVVVGSSPVAINSFFRYRYASTHSSFLMSSIRGTYAWYFDLASAVKKASLTFNIPQLLHTLATSSNSASLSLYPIKNK